MVGVRWVWWWFGEEAERALVMLGIGVGGALSR